VQAAAGIGALTWSIPVGSLPPGLTIAPLTGPNVTISGTPTTQGTFNFTVTVTDSLGQSDTQALSIVINSAPPPPTPPEITTTSLAAGTVGETYSQTVEASGGTGGLTWSIVPGTGTLPSGLNLDPITGVISGTPLLPGGESTFTVRVADTTGQDDSQALSITINLINIP
jgi:hypothetical protein